LQLYIIRHGQTEDNAAKVIMGSRDVPLSENGRTQAKALANRLADQDFDICISSDLARASETMKIVIGDDAFIKAPSLRERNYGEFEGWPVSYLIDAIIDTSVLPEEFCPAGGESLQVVEKRLMSMWNEYFNSFDGIGLLSGHGDVNRSLLKCLMGLSYREQFRLAQDNC